MYIKYASDDSVRKVQKHALKKFGFVPENRVRAFLLLEDLRSALNNIPGKSAWRLLWNHYIFHKDGFELFLLTEQNKTIKNAEYYIFANDGGPSWDEMVETIREYSMTYQTSILDEYLKEIEKYLKMEQ